MSGSGLTDNAEDVLSSIRRLVAGEEAGAVGDSRTPLLLTSAQRVTGQAPEGAVRDVAATSEAATERRAPYVLTERIDTDTPEGSLPDDSDTLDWRDSDASPVDARDQGYVAAPDVMPASAPQDLTSENRALERAEQKARVDDDALRELVAEIVREELTGEFGDRITRNVRKLVRREINRVLSGRNTG